MSEVWQIAKGKAPGDLWGIFCDRIVDSFQNKNSKNKYTNTYVQITTTYFITWANGKYTKEVNEGLYIEVCKYVIYA